MTKDYGRLHRDGRLKNISRTQREKAMSKSLYFQKYKKGVDQHPRTIDLAIECGMTEPGNFECHEVPPGELNRVVCDG